MRYEMRLYEVGAEAEAGLIAFHTPRVGGFHGFEAQDHDSGAQILRQDLDVGCCWSLMGSELLEFKICFRPNLWEPVL